MSDRARWDTDTSGHGVASGRDLVPDALRLADALGEPDWIAEDPQVHLVPHIERSCVAAGSPVRLTGWFVEEDGTLVVRLTAAAGSLDRPSRRLAVFGVVASLAESRTTLHQRPDGAFDVITGVLDGDIEFAPHGHRLRIVVDDAPA